MKIIILSFFILPLYAATGINDSALEALEAEFSSVESISEVTSKLGFPGCDIMVFLKAEGSLRGEATSSYDCKLCLLDAGNNFYDYDRDTIFCRSND